MNAYQAYESHSASKLETLKVHLSVKANQILSQHCERILENVRKFPCLFPNAPINELLYAYVWRDIIVEILEAGYSVQCLSQDINIAPHLIFSFCLGAPNKIEIAHDIAEKLLTRYEEICSN